MIIEEQKQKPPFASALLVEDEVDLSTALRIALRKLGIQCTHASTLQQARKVISQGPVDFVLLDRALPDGDGIELCTELRREGSDCSILILTAKGDTSDRVKGLDHGADDYLSKPFSWEELEARIRALSRRRRPAHGPLSSSSSEGTPWELDPARLRIRKSLPDSPWVVLTPLEFKLASRLIQAQGGIVSREDLLKDVWGFKFLPQTRTVDHFLGRLRKHFELDAEKPAHFITVRGAGYRFEL